MFVIAEAKAVNPSAADIDPHERVATVVADDAFANTVPAFEQQACGHVETALDIDPAI